MHEKEAQKRATCHGATPITPSVTLQKFSVQIHFPNVSTIGSPVVFLNSIKGLSSVLASPKKWQQESPLTKQKRNGRSFSPLSSFGSFARKELSKFLNFS